MPKDQPLDPADFPLDVRRDEIVKSNGEPIAKARDPKVAEEVADRLNENEYRREEDRWSA
ncbi:MULTISPECIES: hypothetical protein [Rhodopseudomonas]|uniref:Uncharacterized protein n=1 Tax=Rhodopseudomonas palustris TaxID=1076 RepID=A0A0D7EP50_RHOPL|nr:MULTISPECIES: hypothetical protein [Rhodopseudomonas]KIZ42320.1 hypothetical protein OO17_13075 [Rhodopseudomonas palustris]MDF3813441.1 hypothetical protein [Rhodopseudomonas sp. BAL398]WOK17367.1 hypothetical protein RBJ75_25150 [Rhodopseudomonas sp. BAL398]